MLLAASALETNAPLAPLETKVLLRIDNIRGM